MLDSKQSLQVNPTDQMVYYLQQHSTILSPSGKRQKNLVDLGSLRMLISLDMLILYLVCLNELVGKHEHEPKQGHKHAKGLKPLKE